MMKRLCWTWILCVALGGCAGTFESDDTSASSDTVTAPGVGVPIDASGAETVQTDTAPPPDSGSDGGPQADASDDACVTNCVDKVCGPDGCGGTCGFCPDDGSTCEEGQCIPGCDPECNGKACGQDGCGGSCGACPDATPICQEGVCVPLCIPDCAEKECGFDGCSGSCGGCPGDKPICNEDGQCIHDPACGTTGCLLTGTVLAPEGTIPIDNALIYASLSSPPPLNESLYCDKCFQLSPETPQTTSTYDGTFTLTVPASGEWQLIIQKGNFRRIRSFEVTAANHALDASLTTLPGVSAPENGDNIPRMAIVGGGYDDIESTIEGLGIAFDLYDTGSGFGGTGGTTGEELMSDWDLLSQYQVVFLPCASGWFDDELANVENVHNIRNFVGAGGRLYVTDWSYDILRAAFPTPIQWLGDNGSIGSAQGGIYDAPAIVEDQGLANWLFVQDIGEFEVVGNWTTIDYVQEYQAPNESNALMTFEPKVWVNADVPGEGVHPATVSFQYGCGRAMFSTYHTESWSESGLMPQERALLYIVLEVVLCIGASAGG